MQTFTGNKTGQHISDRMQHAKRSVWVCSPFITPDYASKLVGLSQGGIKVLVITSRDSDSQEAAKILTDGTAKLSLMILDKTLIHSRTYIIDGSYAVAGTANLTTSAMNDSVETIFVAETPEELTEIENQFLRLWVAHENEALTKEAIQAELTGRGRAPHNCSICKKAISEEVYKYSMNRYSGALCIDCQKSIDKPRKQPQQRRSLRQQEYGYGGVDEEKSKSIFGKIASGFGGRAGNSRSDVQEDENEWEELEKYNQKENEPVDGNEV